MESNTQKHTTGKGDLEPIKRGTGESAQGSYTLIMNWYKINGKNLVGEETLSELHIRKLLSVLGNPIWNQLYHCWTVELKHMPELQPYVAHTFNPDKFVYFIEVYNNP